VDRDKAPSKTEQKILDYFAQDQLDYYDSILGDEGNFQVWYQLSALRTGLVSWYPFRADAEVLEIGAGFGALTGVLCEKCAAVTATERSFVRAQAIAERWSGKENLTVYAGEWSEIPFGKKFDYIVLTGILERVGKGTPDLTVYADWLKDVAQLLKEDGRMLVAVENRYGLKYVCGAAEPHTNRAFDGLQKYRRGTGGYSFARKELEEIAVLAGFGKRRFYYPLPDYKFPQLIYTDEQLPEKNLRERLIPYYTNPGSLIASENALYDDVIAGGVFPFFANSFLLECGYSGETSGAVNYAAISTDRGRSGAYTTAVMQDKTVRKTPVFPEGKASARELWEHILDLQQHGIPVVEHTLSEDGMLTLPYIALPTLSNYIKEIIRTDTAKFEELMDKIYAYILQSSETAGEQENALLSRYPDSAGTEYGPILKKAYMELIPLNCFYDPAENRFLYFDQEFVRTNYPAGYVMFRAVHYVYCFTPDAERFYPKADMIERYHLAGAWEVYVKEEKRFLDEVRNHQMYRQFYRWASLDWKKIDENTDRLSGRSAPKKTGGEPEVSEKLRKTWDVELRMLDEIDRICKKYNLRYYIVHGTLLGAVRHKGFIPWDDDVDIAMLRADYEKFLEVAPAELKEPLSIHNYETDDTLYWSTITRLRNSATAGIEPRNLQKEGNLGMWIDILPMDACPADEKKHDKKIRVMRRLSCLMAAKIYGKDNKTYMGLSRWKWKCCYLFSYLYSHEALVKKMKRAEKLYVEEGSDEIAVYSGGTIVRRLPAADFSDVTYLEFEGRMLPAPVGYENYLFLTQGADYMKYPPEEERKLRHYGIMDPEHSYRDYQNMLGDMFGGAAGKEIILFGSGMMFEDYMKKYGAKYRPAFLVDNDKNKWGRKRMGIDIKAPEAILEVPASRRWVIICSYYYREIIPQLEAMGISDYKVYVQRPEWIIREEKR
jgi:phosphorylcholine metabolism protein LicD/2-polyprenyl-3-methyl-5-hydroxy-6-metoxy-1,4-benzoquinol methylase